MCRISDRVGSLFKPCHDSIFVSTRPLNKVASSRHFSVYICSFPSVAIICHSQKKLYMDLKADSLSCLSPCSEMIFVGMYINFEAETNKQKNPSLQFFYRTKLISNNYSRVTTGVG
jgi:hypothetical protein